MTKQGADTEIIFAKYRAGSAGTTFLKWIGDKTKFINPTDSNENISNQQEANVYGNASEYVPTVSASEAFGDDNTPF
ncbi:hypothetical protein QNH98_18815 [Myroides sp. mNGS23_01]|nr:hypothetical protein [Myroides sp. mNGS23_01]WHT38981.1 hypothetical protein QNH98_18815 [Myroides sp. mNGS23_01]